MEKLNLTIEDREIANVAKKKAAEKKTNILAIELSDGRIITGKETTLTDIKKMVRTASYVIPAEASAGVWNLWRRYK